MKFFFQYSLEDNRVVSYSKGKNEMPDKFLQLELEVTKEEFQKMQRNYLLFIRDGKLVLEKTKAIINEEKVEALELLKRNLREKQKNQDKITVEELADLILQF